MSPVPIPVAAALPAREDDRLRALHALLILDTPPEARFDRIVAFAAQEFDVPVALISLIDRDRQWFKARLGLAVCETGRDVSFCAHAILQDAPMVIDDALADPRFATNPLVLGEPHIRFYAGAPLETPEGHRLGTLCLIDHQPRQLDATGLAILRALRDLAQAELLGRAAEEA
jgi:GAF domain-containing protein